MTKKEDKEFEELARLREARYKKELETLADILLEFYFSHTIKKDDQSGSNPERL